MKPGGLDAAGSANGIARIELLDVLRGIAITCILFMNIPYVADYATLDFLDPRLRGWTALDQLAFGANWMIEGTMRGMLQLLFGAGMMIALRHTMQPNGPVGPLDSYMRRNLLLIAFGAVHVLVFMWPGDILIPYGFAALLLPPFRKLRPRTLFAIGAAITLALTVSDVLPSYVENSRKAALLTEARASAAAGKPLTAEQSQAKEAWDARVNMFALPPTGDKAKAMQEEAKARQGDLASWWTFHTDLWHEIEIESGWITLNVIESFAAMLIGAALFGWGIIQGERSSRFYLRLMLACYGIGGLARALRLDQVMDFIPTMGDPFRSLMATLNELARLPLAVGHIALVVLLLRAAGTARLVRPFAANGKLPLSTYFSASILCMWVIFPAFALGQWGKHGFAAQQGIAFLIIGAQVVAANLWLRTHTTGPAEWLWKSLAYGTRQPWRRMPEGSVAAGTG